MEKNKLPENFKKYFWDCNFDDLNLDQYAFFITERILNFGDMTSLQWLFNRIDKNLVINVLNKSRNINKKTRNYWSTILSS